MKKEETDMEETKKKVKLNAEDLDQITGGYAYRCADGAFEVIDWNGDVVERFTGEDAEKRCQQKCRDLGFSDRVIDWEDLEEILQIRAGTY